MHPAHDYGEATRTRSVALHPPATMTIANLPQGTCPLRPASGSVQNACFQKQIVTSAFAFGHLVDCLDSLLGSAGECQRHGEVQASFGDIAAARFRKSTAKHIVRNGTRLRPIPDAVLGIPGQQFAITLAASSVCPSLEKQPRKTQRQFGVALMRIASRRSRSI